MRLLSDCKFVNACLVIRFTFHVRLSTTSTCILGRRNKLSLSTTAGMTYFSLTWKLALHWFPGQKSCRSFQLDFGLLLWPTQVDDTHLPDVRVRLSILLHNYKHVFYKLIIIQVVKLES